MFFTYKNSMIISFILKIAYYVQSVDNGYNGLRFSLSNGPSYQAAVAQNLQLISGINYTVVISTTDLSIVSAKFGMWMRPTVIFSTGNQNNYVSVYFPAYGKFKTIS